MAADGKEKCIYCKNAGSSREHVAPSSLGGNCTLNCVCVKCNGNTTVDQALAEHSPVALSKIQHTPVSAFTTYLGGYATMQVEGGRQIAMRIANQVATEVRPQFFVDGNQIRVFAADRAGLNELIQFIDKQIERGRLAQTRVFIAEDTKDPRFLMHRSDDAVVSAPSKERAAQFLARLEQQWPEIKTKIDATPEQRQTHKQPSVLINMSLWPNEEYRAIAKIAFKPSPYCAALRTCCKLPSIPFATILWGRATAGRRARRSSGRPPVRSAPRPGISPEIYGAPRSSTALLTAEPDSVCTALRNAPVLGSARHSGCRAPLDARLSSFPIHETATLNSMKLPLLNNYSNFLRTHSVCLVTKFASCLSASNPTF